MDAEVPSMWAMGEGATVSDENSRLYAEAAKEEDRKIAECKKKKRKLPWSEYEEKRRNAVTPECFKPTTLSIAIGTTVRLLKKDGFTFDQGVELLRVGWDIVKVQP